VTRVLSRAFGGYLGRTERRCGEDLKPNDRRGSESDSERGRGIGRSNAKGEEVKQRGGCEEDPRTEARVLVSVSVSLFLFLFLFLSVVPSLSRYGVGLFARERMEDEVKAPTQESLSRQKKDLEEVLRLCYLGKDEDIARQATVCGATRVPLAKDKQGRGGLHFAASNGKTSTVRVLIARYACDADVEDGDGRTPLHFAAVQGHTETVSVLCTFGRAWVDSSDSQDDTPLHLAARLGHASTCLELLEQGASPHARNNKGLTPIGEAVVGGHVEAVSAIGDKDFACLQDRPKSFSLLHLACGQSRDLVASYLLGKVPGLLNDTHNPQRLSPLHSSVLVRSAACVEVLIGAKCEVNLQDAKGNTPLDLLSEEPCLSGDGSGLGDVEGQIKEMLVRNTSSRRGSQQPGTFQGKGAHTQFRKGSGEPRAAGKANEVPFLEQLVGELKQCQGSFEKQRVILLGLSQKYSNDLKALENCLGRGYLVVGDEDKTKSDLVSAIAKSIGEMDRVEKALQVMKTLKAAHEDEDIQDALRDSKVKSQLHLTNDKERLRDMVMSEDFGISKEIQNKLHGLRVFFTSRGFTPSAFTKEIAVEQGKEKEVQLLDEERIKKLEGTMDDFAETAVKALFSFASVQKGGEAGTEAVVTPSSTTSANPTSKVGDEQDEPERRGTTKEEIWQACKRQMLLSLVSLVCTFLLMWVLRRSGSFDFTPQGPDAQITGSADGQASDSMFDEL